MEAAGLLSGRELPFAEPLRLTIPAHTVNMVVLPACIPPVGDVDADGRVGIVDIMLVAGQLGIPNPDLTYDVDNDGDVDLADMRITAGQWRQICRSSSTLR